MSKFVTGVGVVGAYCYLNKPQTGKFGTAYKATVTLDKKDGEALMTAMQKAQAEFRTSHKKKTGKGLPNGELFRLKQNGDVNDDGEFIPSADGTYELKVEKDVKKGNIKIIDCSKPPADITKDSPKIAEGSKVRVMLVINPYNDKGKVSVSLTPVAVQLVELVEYGGVSMEEITDGFDEIEGYVADEDITGEDAEAVDEEENSEEGF